MHLILCDALFQTMRQIVKYHMFIKPDIGND